MKNKKSSSSIKISLEHKLNPLHIYCRLLPVLGKHKAMAFANLYENLYKKAFPEKEVAREA